MLNDNLFLSSEKGRGILVFYDLTNNWCPLKKFPRGHIARYYLLSAVQWSFSIVFYHDLLSDIPYISRMLHYVLSDIKM